MGWQVEVIFNFSPNVASFLLTSGSRKWYVVGAYVPPNDAPDVNFLEQSLEASTKGMEVILLGDFNARIRGPRDAREEDLATALSGRGLVA